MERRDFIREFAEFILSVVFTAFTVWTFGLMMVLLS